MAGSLRIVIWGWTLAGLGLGVLVTAAAAQSQPPATDAPKATPAKPDPKPAPPKADTPPAKPESQPADPSKKAEPKDKPASDKPAAAKPTTDKPAAEKPAGERPGDRPVAERTPSKAAPESLQDLQELQERVQKVLAKTQPATVGVRVGGASGSAVIVSKDGLVLTAGHVCGAPGRNVEFIFPDGKKVKGKTLGVNHDIDSGLMQITDKNDGGWPFVDMGKSGTLKPGDWVIATGHPGGFRSDRPPVVRLGRVLQNRSSGIQTDCTLVGGDSGGPLFDLDGRVVAINSRISGPLTMNFHVPVDTFRDTWDRLASAEEWGANSRSGGPWLGIQGEKHDKGCRVGSFSPESPAQKADLKVGDVITKFNGEAIKDLEQLATLISRKKSGDEIKLEIVRGEETLEKKVILGKRP